METVRLIGFSSFSFFYLLVFPVVIVVSSPIGGTSPVQAVAAGLNHATTGAAGKALNGIKVAYHQSGLTGKVSSTLVTTQQPSGNRFTTGEIYHSDTDMPPKKVSRADEMKPLLLCANTQRVDDSLILPVGHPASSNSFTSVCVRFSFWSKKGKLPPMIGHDQPSTNGNRAADNKVQLSAGDLLGRTHEELVLLLIQLRRQSSALVKARDACLLEMESQVTDLFISIYTYLYKWGV